MRLVLYVDGDNAAFSEEEGGRGKFARILREAANIVDTDISEAPLFDINGNWVGSVFIG